MKRPQFNLRVLFVLTTLVAMYFSAAASSDYYVAIVICVIPFCLGFEWAFKGDQERKTMEHPCRGRILAFMTGALSILLVEYLSIVKAFELIGYLPYYLKFPIYFDWDFWQKYSVRLPLVILCLIPFLTFVFLYWPIMRTSYGPLPPRVSLLLAICTVLTTIWYARGLSYSYFSQVHREQYLLRIAVNLAVVGVLWGLWIWRRHGATFAWRFSFCLLLHYWLFLCVFPLQHYL